MPLWQKPRLKLIKINLVIAYDGTAYQGWQWQRIGLGVQQRVEEALAKLPEHQRVPLVLFHFEDMPYEEIARKLRVSLAKVKTDILRARAALAQILARGVQDLGDRGRGEQGGQGRRIRAAQRVEQRHLRFRAELDQREFGDIGPLAQKLGVECHPGLTAKGRADRGLCSGIGQKRRCSQEGPRTVGIG